MKVDTFRTTLEKNKYRLESGTEIFIEEHINVFNPHPISLLLADSVAVNQNMKILDLCTGSGIIALAIAKKFNTRNITATDISKEAIRNAMRNSKINKVNDNIDFRIGNLFEPVDNLKFDLIVSNPPCMPFPKYGHYRSKEFRLAVDGGEIGDIYYKNIIKSAKTYLKKNGRLILPIPKWTDWKSIIKIFKNEFDEIKLISRGAVRFFLEDNLGHFKRNLESLNDRGIVDYQRIDSDFYFEVPIYEGKVNF